MTGFILKPFRDRVEIASDGASYLPDGTIVGVSCKVQLSDHAPLAVVGSGAVSVVAMINEMILRAAELTCSVDQTISILSESLKSAAYGYSGDSPVRIGIGAISETRGATTFVFSTFSEGDMEAFRLYERPTGFGQGFLPSGDEMLKLGVTGKSLESDAPILFEYMRRQKETTIVYPEGGPIFSIGGHLDLTFVFPDGYEQRRLLTWPDVIGEKVDPERTGS